MAYSLDDDGWQQILERYGGLPGAFDEMLAAPAIPRAHWRGFVRSLITLGREEFARRWEQARRLIRENGVTYDVHGDPRGLSRPWELDPVPLLVSADEWGEVEAAVIQRARLLDLLLADLYGDQRLLEEGVVPADLILPHPGFLRPCHRLRLAGRGHLQLYAADLARGPDGRFQVIADRTQAPSGPGYALENRNVLSRSLADAFRDCHVHRLAGFFRTLRDGLIALAPSNRANPRIALLTPGPEDQSYFEHAYLARYLGLTLVEGGDLTVRDDAVFLKTLGGLQPVDVILRRVDDVLCDPLELRASSTAGVPGLLGAVRAGNVAVTNGLGSGLVESKGLMPFLPALCRRLLAEDLRMPSVATWWCGRRSDLEHVLGRLGELVVKPASPAIGVEPSFGDRLSSAERDDLVRAVRARPHSFVGQEQVTLSTAPVWLGDGLEPRRLVLRVFAVAAPGGGFAVMPGGLARLSGSADTLLVSTGRGGSKDAWILAADAAERTPLPLQRPPQPRAADPLEVPLELRPPEIRRGGSDLPSRVADGLFWLGRYVERAEGEARLIRSLLARLADEDPERVPELPPLLRALAASIQGPPLPVAGDALEHELLALVFDEKRAGSLRATIAEVRRVASIVRDRLSLDTWRILTRLDEESAWRGPLAAAQPGEAHARLNQLILALSALSGLAMESMTRGQGWRFLDMGRRIERAVLGVGLLRNTLVTAAVDDVALLEAILEIGESSMTYRYRYMSSVRLEAVLDLLLADETNPRSVAFQLVALADHVEHLPREHLRPARSPEQRLALAALTSVRLAELAVISAVRGDEGRPDLEKHLGGLEKLLPALSDTLTQDYLTHAEASRQLAGEAGAGGAAGDAP